MSKTMADHARAYRQRKAERVARMEAALREIAGRSVIDAMLDPQWATIAARDALEQ